MINAVKDKFESYPEGARVSLIKIRAAIFELSGEAHIDKIVESLKWGEPSYASKHGSAVRLGWQAKFPDHVSVYFNCNTILVETFKEVYKGFFEFCGNREIKLPVSESIPMTQLMSCISLSLRYHKIKHLPMLGV